MRILSFIFLALGLSGCGCTVVEPGHRGVKVTMGKVNKELYGEGLQWHTPFITSIQNISVKQNTSDMQAVCFSSDLQQISAKLSVLYLIPEKSVIPIFQEYSGNPFDTLIAPRIQEAFKEVSAEYTAEGVVKKREEIKTKALELARNKIGDLLVIKDIVIENIDLSDQLEHAIEAKMVQEQEAAKAKFIKQKAEIEAETRVIEANGEAKAIAIKGTAIKENPRLIDLEIAKKWNGIAPLVVGQGQGANVLLPIKGKE